MILEGEEKPELPDAEIPVNRVFSQMDDNDIPIPNTVTIFETDGAFFPEIIMNNADMAVFTSGNEKGWECVAGDTLTVNVERYPSIMGSKQSFCIGYIKDDICYESKIFQGLDEQYALEIEEEGEYYIYIFSATSDYLSFKEGSVKISSN